LWQEGHTAHATEEEARHETMQMLEVYAHVCEHYLAMPVVRGQKSEKEKFAGAVDTYSIECMMHDKKGLQAGTSHYFGDGFAKAFDITYTDKENKIQHCHQTSWGVSTRLIGGLIMTHGDNSGLIIPPRIAPNQVVIVPIAMHKAGVLEKAEEIKSRLQAAGIRVKLDDSDQSPGWKFAEYEMKGVPLRLEMGPRDMENGQCILARRDSGEKLTASLENLEQEVQDALDAVQQGLFDQAKAHLEANIENVETAEAGVAYIENGGGFFRGMWCGDKACEEKLKADHAITSRNIPFAQEKIAETCIVCQKPAQTMVLWGLAY